MKHLTFYHFVWATWDRVALLEGPIERHAYALIREQCEKMQCPLYALGGTADHIHLLVTLPAVLLTTTVNCAPSSAFVVDGVV